MRVCMHATVSCTACSVAADACMPPVTTGPVAAMKHGFVGVTLMHGGEIKSAVHLSLALCGHTPARRGPQPNIYIQNRASGPKMCQPSLKLVPGPVAAFGKASKCVYVCVWRKDISFGSARARSGHAHAASHPSPPASSQRGPAAALRWPSAALRSACIAEPYRSLYLYCSMNSLWNLANLSTKPCITSSRGRMVVRKWKVPSSCARAIKRATRAGRGQRETEQRAHIRPGPPQPPRSHAALTPARGAPAAHDAWHGQLQQKTLLAAHPAVCGEHACMHAWACVDPSSSSSASSRAHVCVACRQAGAPGRSRCRARWRCPWPPAGAGSRARRAPCPASWPRRWPWRGSSPAGSGARTRAREERGGGQCRRPQQQ